jgi:2-haloacid dehalogenase
MSSRRFAGLRMNQVRHVAAHKNDLQAARSAGCRSAFVARPREFGPDHKPDVTPDTSADVNAADFLDLAKNLGV